MFVSLIFINIFVEKHVYVLHNSSCAKVKWNFWLWFLKSLSSGSLLKLCGRSARLVRLQKPDVVSMTDWCDMIATCLISLFALCIFQIVVYANSHMCNTGRSFKAPDSIEIRKWSWKFELNPIRVATAIEFKSDSRLSSLSLINNHPLDVNRRVKLITTTTTTTTIDQQQRHDDAHCAHHTVHSLSQHRTSQHKTIFGRDCNSNWEQKNVKQFEMVRSTFTPIAHIAVGSPQHSINQKVSHIGYNGGYFIEKTPRKKNYILGYHFHLERIIWHLSGRFVSLPPSW